MYVDASGTEDHQWFLLVLKQNKNENEAKIKILKVQIRKLEKPENKSIEKKQNFAYDQEMYYLFRS